MATATEAATATQHMGMVTAPVTTIRLMGPTELHITPLSDAISMPLLPVSIVIVIGTNAESVRALGQPGRSVSCRGCRPARSSATYQINAAYCSRHLNPAR